jgi:hypothetical protein
VKLGLLSRASELFEYTGLEPVRVDIHFAVEAPYLAGSVVRAGTETPVAGVEVVARFVKKGEETRSSWGRFTLVNGFHFTGRPGNARGTRTGADGRFLLLLPEDGGQQFVSGYTVAALVAGSGEHGWAEDVVIEFDGRTAVEDLRLELRPPSSIEGSVTDSAGEPSVGEVVVASDFQDCTRWAQTDRDGRYRIDRLRAGSYLVLPIGQRGDPSVGHGMAGEESRDGVPPPHELFERPVRVEGGEVTRWDLDVRKDRPGRIEGTVAPEIPSGRLVRHALIVGGVSQEHAPLGGQTQVQDGRFAIDTLHEGTHRLTLMTEYFGDRLAEADVHARRGATMRVRLERPRAALRVPVASRDGAPPTDVRVVRAERLVEGGQGERWAPGPVSAQAGALGIADLPAGRVRVLLASWGRVAAWSEPVLLAAGVESTAPAVTLERGQEIRVRLEPPQGFELPQEVELQVDASPQGPSVQHDSRRVESEPVWILSAFAPGRYHLSARAGGHFRKARAEVEVAPDRPAEAVLKLEIER